MAKQSLRAAWQAGTQVRIRHVIVVVVTVALAVSFLWAGSSAVGADTQTTSISSCTKIDEPGVYEVTAEFNDSSGGSCISITASNVVLEGNGHILRDFDADAIAVEAAGISNVTVRNLTLRGFEVGVELDGVTNGHVESVTTAPVRARVEPDPYWGTQRNGIEVRDGSQNVTIRNNYLESPGEGSDEPDGRDGNGILIRNSSGNLITGNTITSPANAGVWLFGADDNNISNNQIRGETDIHRNSETGIQIGVVSELLSAPAGRSDDNVVRNNEILGTSEFGSDSNVGMIDGIAVRNGVGTRIEGNTIQDVHSVGILIDGAHDTATGGNHTLANNSISRLGGTAVTVFDGSPGTVIRSTTVSQFGRSDSFSSLGDDGMQIEADNVTVAGSDVSSGYGSGLIVENADDVVVRDTDVHDTDAWAVEVRGTTATLDSVGIGGDAYLVSATGTNYTIAAYPVDALHTPTGEQDIGVAYNTSAIGDGGPLSLSVTYPDGAVAALNESTVSMWLQNGTWADIGTGTDIENNTVTGRASPGGVFAPLAANDPPAANLTVSPSTVTLGDALTFEALDSTDSDGSIVEYRWDFDGDGSTDTTTGVGSASHVYSAAGTYNATVTVVDDGGDTGTATVTVNVTARDARTGEVWPESGFDVANTDYAQNNTGPVDNATEKWTHPGSTVVATEETVYVGGPDAVHGLYANDADSKWYQDMSNEPNDLVLKNGVVYVGTGFWIEAYGADSGAERWSTYDPLRSFTVHNGLIYGVNDQAELRSYYATNGSVNDNVAWSNGTELVMSGPAVANDTVYVSGLRDPYESNAPEEGYLVALHADNASKQWTFTRPNETFTRPAVSTGTVYVGEGLRSGGTDAVLHAVDATTGNETWNRSFAGEFTAKPAVAPDTIYVVSGTVNGGGNVSAVNATDGSLRWQQQVDVAPAAPAVVNDTVYVGGANGSLYALNATSGVTRWVYNASTTAALSGSPAITAGTVYIADTTGVIHAVTENGSENPADFELTVTDTNSPLTEGDQVVVNVTVENTGGIAGTQTVTATTGGIERASKELTLESGVTRNVSLNWSTVTGEAGAYRVTVTSDTDQATAAVAVETAEGIIPLDSCSVLPESGDYVLTQSIVDGQAGTCLEVTASDVTIHGQGNTINGVDQPIGSTGLLVEGDGLVRNLTVRNLTVSAWDSGVVVGGGFQNGVANATFTNLTVTSNDEGIVLDNASGVTIRDAVVKNNEYEGINLEEAPNATVRDTVATDNGYEGIYVDDGPNATIRDTLLRNNDDGFVVDDDSPRILVHNVTLRSGGLDGAEIGAANATVRESLVVGTEYEGLVIEGNDVTVHNTTVRDTGDSGLVLSADGVAVRDTTLHNNEKAGLEVGSGVANSTLVGNTLTANGDGITVAGANITVAANTIANNTNAGLAVSGQNLTVSSNTVRNNGVGVRVRGGTDNVFRNQTFTNNSVWTVDVAPEETFSATHPSRNNTFTDADFGFANATLSFTVRGAALRPVDDSSAPAPPNGSADIGVYLNATNTTAGGYLDLTVAYDDAKVWQVNESTLSLWRYNDSWSDVGGSVDVTNDTLSTNVTSFSVFAPLGEASSTDNAPPAAALTHTPAPAYTGEAVTFDATGSSDFGGDIAYYEWDFDGSGDVDANTSVATADHVFETPGTYTATVTVVDEHGLTDTATVTVDVQSRPEATITYSPSSPTVNDTVTFDAADSLDADGSIASYEWDINDDGLYEATGRTVNITYETGGSYPVTLRVTDDDGNTDTVTETVDVAGSSAEPVVVNVSVSPTQVQASDVVTVNATIDNPRSESVELSVVLTNETGVLAENPNLTVSPGTNNVTVFELPLETPGTYNLSVNNVSAGTVTVEQAPTEGESGGGAPGFGLGTAVIALLGAAIVGLRARP